MAVNSKLLEVLPEGYGYVLFVAIDSVFLNMWLARNVGKARKDFEIAYPKMYSEDKNDFNCIQRAHQNYLEWWTPFSILLFTGGLQYPKVAAGAGTVYLLGRIFYAKGYYTGDPKKRSRGGFGMLGLLTLLGCSGSFAAHQLGWLPWTQ